MDFRSGRYVDVVSLAHDMDFGFQFDAVVSASMLEHDPYWKQSVENMVAHLNDDGVLILSWGAAKNKSHGMEESPISETMSSDGTFHSLPAGHLLRYLESLGMYVHKFHYEGNFSKHQWDLPRMPCQTMGDGMGEVCLVAFKDQAHADDEREIDELILEDL